jgi:PAS domain S-box-containing protein
MPVPGSPALSASAAQLAPFAPRYQDLLQRYLQATPQGEGGLLREQALFEAAALGAAVVALAPSLDQVLDLHDQAQQALAETWQARGAGATGHAAHHGLARGLGMPMLLALIQPQLLAERAYREQCWREEHGRLAVLFEQIDAFILSLDPGGQLESCNPAFCRATGWSRLELATLEVARWQGPLPTQATQHLRLPQARRDGSRFIAEWSVSPIFGRNGRLRSHVCIGRDITRVLQVEDGLRENDKLRAVATLAGGIAHDFNNLLGSIMGLAELCEMEVAPHSRQARNLAHIGQAAAKAAALVRQLLDFSRQTPPALQRLLAGELLAHASGLLRAVLPGQVGLKLSVAEDGPVDIDLVQMEQVLLNLTRNAAHAMHRRGGAVRIVVDRADPAGGAASLPAPRHLRLRVADSGTGIAPAVLPKIFEPFFTTKPLGEGTGLGLAAVHGVVSRHGGAIEVASELGVGTTFSVFLPLAAADRTLPAQPTEPIQEPR